MITKDSESKKSPSLINDLNKLLDLLKEDNSSLIDSVVEDFFKLEELSDRKIGGFFFVIYWNRFTNKTKVDYNFDSDNRLNFNPHEKDYVSWIPLLAASTQKLRQETKLLKLLDDETINLKQTASFNDLKNNLNQFKEFLRKKISSKLLRDQKSIFNSRETKDWSFFFNKIEKGERYPIDALPISFQNELFWSKTELFKGGTIASIDYKLYTNLYSATQTFLISNEVLELHPPYEYFEEQIIDLAVYKINEGKLHPSAQNKLIRFINKLSLEQPELKDRTRDKFEILKENIDKYLEVLELKLYQCHKSIPADNPYFMIGDQFSEEEKVEAKEILKKRMTEFLDKNKHRPSNYMEFLDTTSYCLFTKNNQLVESFKNLDALENAIHFAKNNNRTLIYSPIYRNLDGLINVNDQVYDKVENLLIKNNAKTTEFVKDELRNLLSSSFVYFHDRLRKHIQFVVDVLETVEI